MMVCATVMFAGCNKDEAANGGGQTAAGWVDLGLPSGLLWAKCNLGATTPEGYGDYYAWGETATKDEYYWDTYKYCNNGDYYHLTKYNNSRTTLEAMDDAAAQKLGSGARMPTKAEWEELINNTTAEWTTMNGVNGCKFTASNGNSLFLPAAGYRDGSELYHAGSYVDHWSSSLDGSYPYCGAWTFWFVESGLDMYVSFRYCGKSVRPVRSAR